MDTDEALYVRVQQGDLAAFDRLYARYERGLFGFVLRLLGDRAEAEEAFADVFLNVLQAQSVRFEQAHFAAWLFRIARNLCANRLRSRARGRGALARIGALEEPTHSAEERLVEEERASEVAAAVGQLPAALADVFHLRSSGLSYQEIAAVLEVPLGTVKSRMSSLVQQLRGALQ